MSLPNKIPMKPRSEYPETVEYQEWWSNGGGMMYNTHGLNPDHEMHPYNQVLNQGYEPEVFGLENPLHEKYADYTRNDLIRELYNLEKEMESAIRMGMLHGY